MPKTEYRNYCVGHCAHCHKYRIFRYTNNGPMCVTCRNVASPLTYAEALRALDMAMKKLPPLYQ